METLAIVLLLAAQQAPAAEVAAEEANASGAGAGVLVVAEASLPDAQLAALYAGLAAARVPVVGPAERRGVHKEVVVAGQQSLDAVKAANLEARAKWRVLDLDGATAALNKAERAFFDLARPKEGTSAYAETLLLRAEIALTKQNASEAVRELRLLARIDPARKELHPGLYAPALVDAYAAARSANTEAGAGFLTLTPRTERGAAVSASLDAEPIVGVASGVTTSIRPKSGPHLLIVRAPGRKAFATRIELTTQTPVVLSPFLASPFAERERSDLANRIREGDSSALLPLAQRTGASAILLVDVDKKTPATLWALPLVPSERLPLQGSKENPVALGVAVRRALDSLEATDEAETSNNFGFILGGAAVLTGAVALAGMAAGLSLYTYRRGFPGQPQQPIPPIVLQKPTTCCSVPAR